MIKAIDTAYKNHLFRSRLEARYAVYFDELGAEWLYEHEGFELGNGERYLPDFYFPKYKLYAEIKPVKFTYKEHRKCRMLSNMTQKIVIELVGLPSVDLMNAIIPSRYFICPIHGQEYVYDDPRSLICKCGKLHKVFNSLQEASGTLILHSHKASYMPIYYGNEGQNDLIIQEAIKKATQARFEFQNKT